jgi:NadR type nicotinamide-nucleotide adenylyltransferase
MSEKRLRVRRVVLTGSESTGKTELAKRLGEHFGAPVSREFVRDYAAKIGRQLGFADHGIIAHGQMAAEDEAIAGATDLAILDTDLVSTAVYCKDYLGYCPPWIDEEAQKRAGDLYLLLRPDIPWVPDGIRDREHHREEMHALFAERLKAMGVRVVEIGGEREERFAAAVQAIEGVST